MNKTTIREAVVNAGLIMCSIFMMSGVQGCGQKTDIETSAEKPKSMYAFTKIEKIGIKEYYHAPGDYIKENEEPQDDNLSFEEMIAEELENKATDEEWDNMISEEINTEDQEALELPSRRITGESIPYDGKTRSITCWGDSMTQGVGASRAIINKNGVATDVSYMAYPDILQMLTGVRTYNFGVGGETSDEIAIRQGGIPMYTSCDISFDKYESSETEFVLGDGSKVKFSDYSGYNENSSGDNYNIVYINDNAYRVNNNSGEITLAALYKNDDGIWQEISTAATPTDAEKSINSTALDSIPAGTRVYPKGAFDRKDDILILEIGSNGGWKNDYQKLIEQYDDMISAFDCKYYIIVGDTDDPGTSIGDTAQGERNDDGDYIGIGDTSWEAALREAYGNHFFNTRTYMIEYGLSDTGIQPTQADLTYAMMGRISPQLRSDWTHFNSYGYYTKALGIYKKGIELGYWN